MEIDDKSDPGAWELELERSPWLRRRMQVTQHEHFVTELGDEVDIEKTGTFEAVTIKGEP